MKKPVIVASAAVFLITVIAGFLVLRGEKTHLQTSVQSQSDQQVADEKKTHSERHAEHTENELRNRPYYAFRLDVAQPWRVVDESLHYGSELHALGVDVFRGDVLAARIFTTIGKGGFCEPKAQDVPHRAGNECPTQEYISSAPVRDGGVLLKSKYTKADGTVMYGYCFRPEAVQNTAPARLNEPIMGYALVCESEEVTVMLSGYDNSTARLYELPDIQQLEAYLLNMQFIWPER